MESSPKDLPDVQRVYVLVEVCVHPRLLLIKYNFKRYFCGLHDSITILNSLLPKVAETKTRKRIHLMEIVLKRCGFL